MEAEGFSSARNGHLHPSRGEMKTRRVRASRRPRRPPPRACHGFQWRCLSPAAPGSARSSVAPTDWRQAAKKTPQEWMCKVRLDRFMHKSGAGVTDSLISAHILRLTIPGKSGFIPALQSCHPAHTHPGVNANGAQQDKPTSLVPDCSSVNCLNGSNVPG